MQPAWKSQELSGRINIVLSEQLVCRNSGSQESDLGITNDIVCFSFQHAPKGMQDLLSDRTYTKPAQTYWSKRVSHGQSAIHCICQMHITPTTRLQILIHHQSLQRSRVTSMTFTCDHHYRMRRHHPRCSGPDRIHHRCPTIQTHHSGRKVITNRIYGIAPLAHFVITSISLVLSRGLPNEAHLTRLATYLWTTVRLRLRSH
jgi:hypothetical protein